MHQSHPSIEIHGSLSYISGKLDVRANQVWGMGVDGNVMFGILEIMTICENRFCAAHYKFSFKFSATVVETFGGGMLWWGWDGWL